MKTSRKDFIKKAGLSGIVALSIPGVLSATHFSNSETALKPEEGLTFLFQGDSITDGNRTRNNDWNHVLGHGYQYIIASKLWFENPNKNYMFYNRGISGNRVKDLESRWQKDALDLKPDVLSILVGINDVDAIINNRDPESIEEFERHYSNILEQTKSALPNTILVLCESFILPVGRVKENLKNWQNEVSIQQKVIRRLAKKYKAVFVELQQPFNDAYKKAAPEYWIWDGIHPMPGGHELIAREWLKEVQKQIKISG